MKPQSNPAGAEPGRSEVHVRAARPGDIDCLVEFNRAMARETEALELDAERLRRGVSEVFEDAHRGRYFIAEVDGRAAATLCLTYEWSDWRAGVFWWIQSVYVAPDARRKGLYRALYEHVLQAAQTAKNVCGIRLYVDADNTGAQAVYAKLGMQHARYHMYEVDFVMGER